MGTGPLIAGVAGGVGTTVLASALHAYDDDLYAGGPVDVLVCRSTVDSLGEAHRAVAQAPYPPVLAIVADMWARGRRDILPGEVKARLRMVEPYTAGLVAVPFVAQWRTRESPYQDAAYLLCPDAVIPGWLGEFATAMTRLIARVESVLDAHRHDADRSELLCSRDRVAS